MKKQEAQKRVELWTRNIIEQYDRANEHSTFKSTIKTKYEIYFEGKLFMTGHSKRCGEDLLDHILVVEEFTVYNDKEEWLGLIRKDFARKCTYKLTTL